MRKADVPLQLRCTRTSHPLLSAQNFDASVGRSVASTFCSSAEVGAANGICTLLVCYVAFGEKHKVRCVPAHVCLQPLPDAARGQVMVQSWGRFLHRNALAARAPPRRLLGLRTAPSRPSELLRRCVSAMVGGGRQVQRW